MGIAIVSVYPPRGEHHSKMSGVASMSKNIADTISTSDRVHIISNKIQGKKGRYVEDNITVHRCWDRGPRYPLQIVRTLYQLDGISAVHVHHEYDGMYGGVLMNALFPLLLLGLRLTGAKVVTQPHGVVFYPDVINKQSAGSAIGMVPDAFLRIILLCFNQLLVSLSDKLVVPNSVLQKTFLDHCIGGEDKLTVIPHGVESNKIGPRSNSSSGGPMLLYFGYITWRKGPDILAAAAQSLPEEWEIVLAGGKVPYLSEEPSYDLYYEEVHELATQSDNITLTGFVDEDDLDTYFKRADVLVLPYRSFVAASGVFSLGLRYSLPFLLSEDVSPLLENEDVKALMNEHDINKSKHIFSISNAPNDLEKKVGTLCEDSEQYKSASTLSHDICKARNWAKLRDKYAEVYA